MRMLIFFIAMFTSPATVFAQGVYHFNGQVIQLESLEGKTYEPPQDLSQLLEDGVGVRRIDLRSFQSSVKNQGSRGSCSYFAAAGLIEEAALRFYDYNKELNISEEYLIYTAKGVYNRSARGDGSQVSDSIWAFNNAGFMLEEHMPYSYSWFAKGLPCERYKNQDPTAPVYCYAHYQPLAENATKIVRPAAFDLDAVRVSSRVKELIGVLSEQRPVTIGVPTHPEGWDRVTGEARYTKEMQDDCKINRNRCGGHAILLVGFDMDKEEFYFKNSWGNTWGDGGYGSISFEYVNNFSHTGGAYIARFNDLPFDLANAEPKSLEPEITNVRFDMDRDFVRDGQKGALVTIEFDLKAIPGSFFYVSLFAQTASPQSGEDYAPISYVDADGNTNNVHDLAYFIVDLVGRGPDNKSIELFIPYAHLEETRASGKEIYLRPSVYKMTDVDDHQILFRSYEPLFTQELATIALF